MEHWTPLSADEAIQRAQDLSEVATIGGYADGPRYAIAYRHFDNPEKPLQLEAVTSKEEADNLKFWIEAEEVLCLMGCKREVAEVIAYEFRDAIALRGEKPTLDEVVERGGSVQRMFLHAESPLRQKGAAQAD